jgi:hypothetical protein
MRLTKIINNKKQNICEKIYGGGKEEWRENVSHKPLPFIHNLLHSNWLNNIDWLPCGQSRVAT